ncbi:hypothetical protein SAMN05444421_101523 [Celeribacter marinus]|nr:hypothetical protein SAMN05444421_101523 [Celeribacter marinus]
MLTIETSNIRFNSQCLALSIWICVAVPALLEPSIIWLV